MAIFHVLSKAGKARVKGLWGVGGEEIEGFAGHCCHSRREHLRGRDEGDE